MLLLRPVDKTHPITQRFGENPAWYPYTKGHNGIDYGCPIGTPVLAAASGQVIRADLDSATALNPKTGYGYHVRIQHADGSITIYGHLGKDDFLCSTGDVVDMGDVIGLSGNTGFSTGPHLHFELRAGFAVLSCIDPAPMMVDEIPSSVPLFDAIIVERMNVRAGPGVRFRTVNKAEVGTTIPIFGLAGDVWLRTEDGFIKYDSTWQDLVPIKNGGEE